MIFAVLVQDKNMPSYDLLSKVKVFFFFLKVPLYHTSKVLSNEIVG